jgi:hypothetical protein
MRGLLETFAELIRRGQIAQYYFAAYQAMRPAQTGPEWAFARPPG